MKSKYEFLDHTADIKFKAFGKTINEVFENAVLAVSSVISDGKIHSVKGKTINVTGNDQESLLYNFIEEILYLLDAEDFVTCKAVVTIRGNNLKADLYGDKASKYNGLEHVKSPTYAEMHIKKIKNNKKNESDYWEIQMVLDV